MLPWSGPKYVHSDSIHRRASRHRLILTTERTWVVVVQRSSHTRRSLHIDMRSSDRRWPWAPRVPTSVIPERLFPLSLSLSSEVNGTLKALHLNLLTAGLTLIAWSDMEWHGVTPHKSTIGQKLQEIFCKHGMHPSCKHRSHVQKKMPKKKGTVSFSREPRSIACPFRPRQCRPGWDARPVCRSPGPNGPPPRRPSAAPFLPSLSSLHSAFHPFWVVEIGRVISRDDRVH